MSFQVKHRTLIIRMPAELDHHTAQEIRKNADRMITERNINQIEFDFRDTDFMDSSGIGLLMGRYQNIRLLGGDVIATHVNNRVFQVMQIAGLSKVLIIQRERVWSQEE